MSKEGTLTVQPEAALTAGSLDDALENRAHAEGLEAYLNYCMKESGAAYSMRDHSEQLILADFQTNSKRLLLRYWA